MILGEVEETVTSADIDDETSEGLSRYAGTRPGQSSTTVHATMLSAAAARTSACLPGDVITRACSAAVTRTRLVRACICAPRFVLCTLELEPFRPLTHAHQLAASSLSSGNEAALVSLPSPDPTVPTFPLPLPLPLPVLLPPPWVCQNFAQKPPLPFRAGTASFWCPHSEVEAASSWLSRRARTRC